MIASLLAWFVVCVCVRDAFRFLSLGNLIGAKDQKLLACHLLGKKTVHRAQPWKGGARPSKMRRHRTRGPVDDYTSCFQS